MLAEHCARQALIAAIELLLPLRATKHITLAAWGYDASKRPKMQTSDPVVANSGMRPDGVGEDNQAWEGAMMK